MLLDSPLSPNNTPCQTLVIKANVESFDKKVWQRHIYDINPNDHTVWK